MTHPPLRVAIDEEQFRRLVAGEAVCTQSTAGIRVEFILGDIGFRQMMWAILDGMGGETMAPMALIGADPPQAREFLPARRPARRRR